MKVLVTAASKHGSTAEIASVIARVPPDGRHRGRRHRAGSRDLLAGYDAVVVGSAVYAGHWLGPAKAFVLRYRVELVDLPVFLFSSGPIGDPPKPAQDPTDMVELDEATGAVDHQVFAGRVIRESAGVLRAAGHHGRPCRWRLPPVGRHRRLGEGDRQVPEGRAGSPSPSPWADESPSRVTRTRRQSTG